MYWEKQEQFVFDIILFILVFFQLATFFMMHTGKINFGSGMFFVGLNFVLLMAMIPYAKWDWKTVSYKKAFLQLIKHELIILGLSAVGIVLAILTIRMKGQT